MIYFLLFIIALLVGVIIFLLVRNVQGLKLLRKQHLQIIADADFRGMLIRHKNAGKSIDRQFIYQALREAGIKS